MAEGYIKSPINYTGSKYRLLKHIIPLFPKDIDIFVDLFGGAFNVGINAEAKNLVYNDINNYLEDLFKYWYKGDLQEINAHIDSRIKEYGLSATDANAFYSLRDTYNQTKDIRDLFILLCYSFNFQIRFNNKQQYNSSFGKEASTMNPKIRQNLDTFVNALQGRDCTFFSVDFTDFDFSFLREKDFVYCDCPYSVGTAVYQDGKRGFKGWSKKDDIQLFAILDALNDRGIRFALSNAFENKGIKNEELMEWSKNYTVHHLQMNYNGSNYQRRNSKADEVLITNYIA